MSQLVEAQTIQPSRRLVPLDYIFRALAILSVVELGALVYDIALHPDAPGILNQGLIPRVVLGLIAGPSMIAFSALLLWRAPKNVIGRVLLLAGIAEVGMQFAFDLGSPLLSALAFELVILFLAGVVAPSVAYLLFNFPTGTFYPPRWATWVKSVLVVKSLGVVLDLLANQHQVGIFALSLNPLYVPMLAPFHSLIAVTIGMEGILLPILVLAGIASLVMRYRAAETRVRQQIKWVLLPPIVGIVGALVALAIRLVTATSAWLIVQMTFFTLAQFTLLASLTMAILRYRLFDIDRLINRTLVYGVLTVSVIGVYGLVIGLLSVLFETSGNYLIAFVATALIAIWFQHARDHIQRGVNRLMYGERDEPYAALSRLGQRLETTLAPDAVLPTIVETVAQALKLPYVAIEIKSGQWAVESDQPMAIKTEWKLNGRAFP